MSGDVQSNLYDESNMNIRHSMEKTKEMEQ